MCGIAGTIGLVNRDVILAMIQAMVHRGPDDEGVFLDESGGVALGHRRLSIIDLSSAGHQPMSYLRGRYWTVYNGEIYNFKQLRQELEAKGYGFVSNTDTEVLLAAYAEWGRDCLEKLRGMFAFAIYDRHKREVFLARDRFGIKPLYYVIRDGVFIFASEIKALLASGLVPRHVDLQAIWDFLSLGSIPPPRTIIENVKALLPGHAMIVDSERNVHVYRYWDIWENSLSLRRQLATITLEEAARELREKLEEATRLHMIADVPVGAFLSGGTDSTSVVGLMSQYVSRPLKTYSVGFESQYAKLDERKWARIASERFGTDHTEVVVTGEDVAREYDRLIHAIDQPSLDGTNTYFVSKAASEDVTVALSGQGGDELLAGYPHFRRFVRAAEWDRQFPPRIKPFCYPLIRMLPKRLLHDGYFLTSSQVDRFSMIRNLADERLKYHIVSGFVRKQFKPRPLGEFYRGMLLNCEADPISLTSYVEIKGYLAHTLLRDGDAMSMAHSLEVRPLLLDHVVAEYIFALPPHLKLANGRSKKILIESLRDLLPEPIVNRRKMGFEMPLFDWLTGPLRERALTALSSRNAQDLFSEDFLAEARSSIREPRRKDRKLWAYVLLIEWMNAHKCSVA